MITVYRFEYPAQFRNPFCKGTVEDLNEPEGKNNVRHKEQQYDGKFVPDACKKTVLYRLYINRKIRTIQTDGMFIGFSYCCVIQPLKLAAVAAVLSIGKKDPISFTDQNLIIIVHVFNGAHHTAIIKLDF